MNKGIGNFKARFVRQEAQKPPGKGLLGQSVDIRDGYLLGLRFKPAPVFHFFWSGDARRRGSGFFLKQAKSGQTAVISGMFLRGVMFGE